MQVDGTWLYDKYMGTILLMVMAQDGNYNIFRITLTLVGNDTKDVSWFLLNNLRTHVTPQSRPLFDI